jgi:hypothetical protein
MSFSNPFLDKISFHLPIVLPKSKQPKPGSFDYLPFLNGVYFLSQALFLLQKFKPQC